jgi:pSer/pThr/pTyr-binding forkhead associated (FHA) protein
MNDTGSAVFSAACGLMAPLEIKAVRPGQTPLRYTLIRPWVLVGRDPRTTIPLDHPSVSLRHAYLQFLEGRLLAIDLLSRAGLLLDGKRVHSAWVDPGQRLFLGECQIKLISPGLADSTAAREAARVEGFPDPAGAGPADVLQRGIIEVYRNGKHKARCRVSRTVALVGNSERCRIRLAGEAISRCHCSLVPTPQGVWVIDLLSRTGISVNGKAGRCWRLSEGDILQVGEYELRYRDPSPPLPAAAPPGLVRLEGARGLPQATTSPVVPVVLPAEAGHAQANPLMQQFASMQHLMFDQFSQMMGMLVQMLSTMHQEQASMLRAEMQQFQKATEELNRLQQQLREGQKSATPTPPSRDRWQPGAWAATQPQPPASVPTAGTERPPLPAPQPAVPAAAGTNGSPEAEEAHDWLTGRISELESERQTSWQRLMGFLGGR